MVCVIASRDKSRTTALYPPACAWNDSMLEDDDCQEDRESITLPLSSELLSPLVLFQGISTNIVFFLTCRNGLLCRHFVFEPLNISSIMSRQGSIGSKAFLKSSGLTHGIFDCFALGRDDRVVLYSSIWRQLFYNSHGKCVCNILFCRKLHRAHSKQFSISEYY